VLENFVRQLNLVDGAVITVRAGRVRSDERRGNFTNWPEQDAEVRDLQRRLALPEGKVNVSVSFPADGYFVDHDRLVYLGVSDKDTGEKRFYKIILGQGLYGFHESCRRRSHGVWFQVTREEWTRIQ
jgi:hypothetical protein